MTQLVSRQVVLDSLQDSIVSAVTQYDMRESKKKSYNRYALGQYFMAIDRVLEMLNEKPETLTRYAIIENFNGRLCDAILHRLAFAPMTDSEARYGNAA